MPEIPKNNDSLPSSKSKTTKFKPSTKFIAEFEEYKNIGTISIPNPYRRNLPDQGSLEIKLSISYGKVEDRLGKEPLTETIEFSSEGNCGYFDGISKFHIFVKYTYENGSIKRRRIPYRGEEENHDKTSPDKWEEKGLAELLRRMPKHIKDVANFNEYFP